MVALPVLAIPFIKLGVDDRDVFANANTQSVALNCSFDNCRTPNQNRLREIFIDGDLHGPQYSLTFALCVDDPAAFGRHAPGSREYRLHQRATVVDELL